MAERPARARPKACPHPRSVPCCPAGSPRLHLHCGPPSLSRVAAERVLCALVVVLCTCCMRMSSCLLASSSHSAPCFSESHMPSFPAPLFSFCPSLFVLTSPAAVPITRRPPLPAHAPPRVASLGQPQSLPFARSGSLLNDTDFRRGSRPRLRLRFFPLALFSIYIHKIYPLQYIRRSRVYLSRILRTPRSRIPNPAPHTRTRTSLLQLSYPPRTRPLVRDPPPAWSPAASLS